MNKDWSFVAWGVMGLLFITVISMMFSSDAARQKRVQELQVQYYEMRIREMEKDHLKEWVKKRQEKP